MTPRFAVIFAGAIVVAATGCAAPTARSLADEALTAMGGADKVKAIKTLTMKDGAGTREQLLEPRHVGEAEPPRAPERVRHDDRDVYAAPGAERVNLFDPLIHDRPEFAGS